MTSRTLHNIATKIDSINQRIGLAVSWLSLALVVLIFCIVIFRYLFELNWLWLQELAQYFHAMIFMLGIAYTLKVDGHVRVDILSRNYSAKAKARVDLIGTLLLLFPVCIFIMQNVWLDVSESWLSLEGALDTGGLPFTYVLKSTMFLMPALLLLQGIAICARSIITLKQADSKD